LSGGAEYRHDTATSLDSFTGLIEGGAGNLAFHLSANTLESGEVEIPGNAQRLPEEGEEHEEEGARRGEIPNTDTESDSATLGASFHLGDSGFVGFAVNHQEREYGIPPGAHGHHEEEEHDEEEEEEEVIRIDLEQTRYDTQLHLHDIAAGVEVLRGFLTYTDYEHRELEGIETGTVYDRETFETRAELVHAPIADAHGVVGLQWREDQFEATGAEAYVPRTESSEVGLFIVEDIHAGDWLFEIGLRGDWVERNPEGGLDSADFTSLSVSGAGLWAIDENWQLGLSLSRSERAPSTEELFSNADILDPRDFITHAATGLIEVGDPDLDEEVSANLDFSLSFNTQDVTAELTLFYNHFEDYISLFNTGTEIDETRVYAYGQQDTVFTGVEFSGEYTVCQLAGGDVSLGLRGDLLRGKFDDAGQVPRLPPSRFGGKLQWANDSLATWVDVQYAADQDRPGQLEEASRAYTRINVGADYTLGLGADGDLTVFVRGKNLSDAEIRASTSFLRDFAPEAGRSLEAGVRLTF
jgi:iron complex outermembrane receptor protein